MRFFDMKTNSADSPTPQQAGAMQNAIFSQCFGALAELSFTNGLLLVFLTSQQISSSRTLLYLSIPSMLSLFQIVFGYQADRRGKKRMGTAGCTLAALGFAGIVAAAFASHPLSEVMTVLGIVVFSIGGAMFFSCWFALMNPLVPEHLRGRFWGTLRLSWQLVVIVFTIACAAFLGKKASQAAYQVTLGLIALALVVRMFFYVKIPELGKAMPTSEGFFNILKKVTLTPNYLPFCSYVFLLRLATSCCPAIFGLIEKRVLDLTDGQVVWLGGMTMVGSVFGFWLSGKAIDAIGTKPVFLVCHFGYGVVLFLFLARGFAPLPVMYTIGVVHFLFGFMFASSSVAVTTEMLALIPSDYQSMATSFCVSMYKVGMSLSGVLAAGILSLRTLNESWTLWGASLSNYDTILLLAGGMVILLVVTLGLIPSVIGRHRWVPGA